MRKMTYKLGLKSNPDKVIGTVTFRGRSRKEVARNARAYAKAMNISGFQDESGFHPIRGSKGYSPAKAGEGKSAPAKRARAVRYTRKSRMGR